MNSPFATIDLAKQLGRDGVCALTEDILNGKMPIEFITEIDALKEILYFIAALQRRDSKKIGQLVEELQYSIDNDTYR